MEEILDRRLKEWDEWLEKRFEKVIQEMKRLDQKMVRLDHKMETVEQSIQVNGEGCSLR